MTEADRYLLEQIRRGDAEGWAALVSRYQGRLLAFARGRLRQPADAEDIVQDTFFHFLKGLPAFRQDASVETYLFTILRRKLVDHFRGKHMRLCSLQEVLDAGGATAGGSSSSGDAPEAASRLAGPDPTASWYARQDEQAGLDKSMLAAALGALLDRLKAAENLRDLRVIEMLFYGQLRNKDVAKIAGIDEKHVALIKHRALNEVRQHVAGGSSSASPSPGSLAAHGDSMVTEVWEEQRLTCPKRSTIGRYLLGTLEKPWQEHVDFHVNRLGCRFCRANLDDLQRKGAEEDAAAVRDRILHSTIGFFKK